MFAVVLPATPAWVCQWWSSRQNRDMLWWAGCFTIFFYYFFIIFYYYCEFYYYYYYIILYFSCFFLFSFSLFGFYYYFINRILESSPIPSTHTSCFVFSHAYHTIISGISPLHSPLYLHVLSKIRASKPGNLTFLPPDRRCSGRLRGPPSKSAPFRDSDKPGYGVATFRQGSF